MNNTLDTVKQGYMCLYCSDSIATIKCKHDYVKDTTDHVLLCENCHNEVWGGETCEQETAEPQANKTIDEILETLLYGHGAVESHEPTYTTAKQQIQALITEARVDEVETFSRYNSSGLNYAPPRLAVLRDELKEKNG